MKIHTFRYLCTLSILHLTVLLSLFAQNNVRDLNVKAERHIEEGEYLKAEMLLQQLDSMQYSTANTLSADYANTLKNLGYVQARKGKYQKSDSIYRKVLDIQSNINKENSVEYALTLIDLGGLHIEMQYFEDVEEKLFIAKNIIKNKLGDDGQYYADVLFRLAQFYCFSQQAEKALDLLNKAEEIYSNCLGEHHWKYANLMTTYGTFYFFLNDYKSSDQYYSKAKLIFQSGEYKNHPDYLSCLFAKTSLDGVLGRFDTAESTLLEGLELVKKYYGEEHSHYAGALSNLGGIYFRKGEYKKAEQTLKESLRISSIIFGKKHSTYFNALNMLAEVYMGTGAYELAEPLFLESLSLRKELYGENNQSVFTAMNSLANLYISIGNYNKAEKMIEDALENMELLNIDESITYALLMIEKASLYEYGNKNEEALTLYEEAGQIFKRELGEDHLMYIILLGNITYTKMLYNKDFIDIENSWLDVLSRLEKVVGIDHPNYIGVINNLATYYTFSGNYGKARTLLEKNIDALKNSIGESSTLYQSMLWNLVMNEEIVGNSEKAHILCDLYFELKREQIQRFFTFMSEKEREIFITSFGENLNLLYSLYCRYRQKTSLTEFIYNYKLLSKSLLLNSSRHLQQSLLRGDDKTLRDEWLKLKEIKNKLIELEKQSDEKQKEALEETASILEKKILAASKEYNETQQDFSLKWQDIQNSLANNEAAIEYVNFTIMCPSLIIDTLYYAMIVCPDRSKPEIIFLCNVSVLRDAMQKSQYDFSAVYSLVWKPLEKYFKKKNNIYVSSSGLLNGVSFAGMQKGKYSIHNVLSTKDIVNIKKRDDYKIATPKAVLFGGVDFSVANKDSLRTDSDLNYDNISSITRSIINDSYLTRGQGFSYLLGSKGEVLAIDTILKDLGWGVDLYMDKHATKARFKALSFSSPDILHISTHGFYYPKSIIYKQQNPYNENPYKISDNPLIRSGLAFAGANNIWDKNKTSIEIDDGILTAYEISNLDLSNTKLVVLSACKTGLGDIIGNEGIYGLQRAFRLAGVEYLIVSLWDIDDNSTLEFMKEFYSLWNNFDKYNIREAFFKAQNTMKVRYPKNPEKWGGFILIE